MRTVCVQFLHLLFSFAQQHSFILLLCLNRIYRYVGLSRATSLAGLSFPSRSSTYRRNVICDAMVPTFYECMRRIWGAASPRDAHLASFGLIWSSRRQRTAVGRPRSAARAADDVLQLRLRETACTRNVMRLIFVHYLNDPANKLMMARTPIVRTTTPPTLAQRKWQAKAGVALQRCVGTWRSIKPQVEGETSARFAQYGTVAEEAGTKPLPVHRNGDPTPLNGLVFCFTGEMKWWPRTGGSTATTWTSMIKSFGGIVSKTMTRKVKILVTGGAVYRPNTPRSSSSGERLKEDVTKTKKYITAKERGLRIVDEAELYEMCASRSRSGWRGGESSGGGGSSSSKSFRL